MTPFIDPVVSKQNTTSTRGSAASHAGRRPRARSGTTIRQHDTTACPAPLRPPPPPPPPPALPSPPLPSPAAAAALVVFTGVARHARTAAAHAAGSRKSLQTTTSRPAQDPPGPSAASIPA
jgi:hypothetical protein